MSKFTAYIVPFNDDGSYSDNEIEITEDIERSSLGRITQTVDNNQYNVGVLTYNDFNLKLRNEHGKYSDIGQENTIFRYKRNDSIFRLYWQIESYPPYCGLAISGLSRLSERKLIYEGFIKDEATEESVRDQFTLLKVLSFESILSQIDVPNGVLNNGDTFTEAIFDILNQTLLTNLLTIDVANFSVGYETTLDDVSSLAQLTGKEALDELLLISNSILFIKDRVLYIKGRDEVKPLAYTFYGPASLLGLENIQDITSIKTGVSKVFNFWTWENQSFSVEDATSIAKWGVRKKEIRSLSITNITKQQSILAALATQYGPAKKSFNLTSPLNYQTLPLYFLDKVVVDYPTVFIALPGRVLPVYDSAIYDEDYYPKPEQSLVIDIGTEWKINSVNIDVQKQLVQYELREV